MSITKVGAEEIPVRIIAFRYTIAYSPELKGTFHKTNLESVMRLQKSIALMPYGMANR